MSYILDAIRKSDQQRQRNAAPTVLTAPTTEAAPRQSAFLIYGLLAAALIGAGMVIGWLRPWQPALPMPTAEPVAAKPFETAKSFESAKPYESSSRQSAPASLSALPETSRKPLPAAEAPLQKPMSVAQPAPATADVAAKQGLPASAKIGAPGAQPKEAVAPAPDKPANTGVSDPTQGKKVLTIAEIPLSIQQEIPKMVISLHAYSSKPAERLVSINDRLLREGDNLAEGLKLEQVTSDGMTFSYKGYRFHRGVR